MGFSYLITTWMVLAAACGVSQGRWLQSHDHDEIIEATAAYPFHLFNSIHNAMRQFGNALDHNGMSIYLATVPADVEFYHGTSQRNRVNGTEWLAFEAEHATGFARPHQAATDEVREGVNDFADHGKLGGQQQFAMDDGHKGPSRGGGHGGPGSNEGGYLHTYRTKRDLRLLYVDGQSAAKSSLGTLDTQDFVLREDTELGSGAPIERDRRRAEDICERAERIWHGKVDGVIRMVGGFEIIVCDFAETLDIVSITKPETWSGGSNFNYAWAVASRFDDIGGGRVHLHHDKLINMLEYPTVTYFDDEGRPRVNSSAPDLMKVRTKLRHMIMEKQHGHEGEGRNWQQITDMIVSRYADRLSYMTSGAIQDVTTLQRELNFTLQPFIDYRDHNATETMQRCERQHLPRPTHHDPPAARALRHVAHTICATLVETAGEKSFVAAINKIEDLKAKLAWTEFRRCHGCELHEICSTPIWPRGEKEDFLHPKCVTGNTRQHGGYWDLV